MYKKEISNYIELGKIAYTKGFVSPSVTYSLLNEVKMLDPKIASLKVKNINHLGFTNSLYSSENHQYCISLTSSEYIKGIASTPIKSIGPHSYLSYSISSKYLLFNLETVSKLKFATGLDDSKCVKLYSSAVNNARAVSLYNTIINKKNTILLNTSQYETKIINSDEYSNYINKNQIFFIDHNFNHLILEEKDLVLLKIGLKVWIDSYTTDFLYNQFCNGYKGVLLNKEILVEDTVFDIISGKL